MDRANAITPISSMLKGIAWLIFSIIAFQGMIGTIKALSPALSPYEAGFWRNLFAIPMILPFVWHFYGRAFWRVNSPKAITCRAFAEYGLSVFNFIAITVLPLALATALVLTTPIWITIGAALFLGERISIHRVAAVALGFIGMMVVVGPVFDTMSVLVFLPIIAAIFWASSNLLLRYVRLSERVGHIMLWMVIIQAPLFLLLALPGWSWPQGDQWWLLMFCALSGTIGQYGLTLAHRHAEASQLAPFGYAELIIAAVVGMLVFHEYPGWGTYLGGAIIAVAGFYIAYRERRVTLKTPLNTLGD